MSSTTKNHTTTKQTIADLVPQPKKRMSPHDRAQYVLALERRLEEQRKLLLDQITSTGPLRTSEGTFYAAPKGWRPDREFTLWLAEAGLLKQVVKSVEVMSMPLVNKLAARKTEVAGYITMKRAAAAQTLQLRFRGAGASTEDNDEENSG